MARWLVWQLADAAFPAGGFAHSSGLEAAHKLGEVAGEDALDAFVEAVAWQIGLGALPLLADAHAWPDDLIACDRIAEASLTNHVVNRASRTQGRAFAAACARSFDAPALARLDDAARTRQLFAHFAPLFGAATRALDLDVDEARSVFLYSQVRGLLSAAVRLGILGPYAAQHMLRRHGPTLDAVLAASAGLGREQIAQPSPLLDVFAGAHDQLYSRLFLSLGLRPLPPLPSLEEPLPMAHNHDHDHDHNHDNLDGNDRSFDRDYDRDHTHHRPPPLAHGHSPTHSHSHAERPGAFHERAPARRRDFSRRAFTVGVGGPVGSGKTALVLALCRAMRESTRLGVVTNDIFTREDAEFLHRNQALASESIRAVETGGCPHAAIREDISHNLDALEQLSFEQSPELLLLESGGDNLAAQFSRELADYTIYVIDVAGGDKVPRKGGPGITQSDLLVINKTDLAPHVGADLGVMARDARAMRGEGPVIFAQCTHGVGIDDIIARVLAAARQATESPPQS